MPKDKNFPYPPVGFYFSVKFKGGGVNSKTSFKEVSGLSVNVTPEEIQEGGVLGYKHRLPTVAKYSNLVLKRGLITNSELRKWIERGINDFNYKPVQVTVSLLGEDDNPLMTWEVNNAWPVKWEVSNFNSMNNELVIESIELAFDSFKATHPK